MKDIQLLKKAIRETHGCESRHVESVPVTETFGDQIAWQGKVEVFDLTDHPQAQRAYAWTYRDGNQNKAIAVLGIPPVDSPQTAVKVAIASSGRLIAPTTGQPMPASVRSWLREIGSRGGTSRAKRLSAERRSEIARMAAKARFSETHEQEAE